MPGFTDDGLKEYAYNTHFRWLETQLFNMLSGRDPSQYQRMAREDVRRDLRRLGYIDPVELELGGYDTWPLASGQRRGEIANKSAKAAANVRVTAGPDGATLAAGAIFQDMDPYGDADQQPALDSARGAYRWELLAPLTLAAGASATVAVRATVAGSPHNLCPLGALYLATPNAGVAAVALVSITTDGVDHQLARLATYRALDLAFSDLMTSAGDLADAKQKLYARRYKEEFERMTSAGIEITKDGDGTTSQAEDEMRYGNVRRYRS